MNKLFITLFFSFNLWAMNIGFNQAWFHNDYGAQYLDHRYDSIEVNRIFSLAKKSGAKSLRLWFFESHDFPMLIIRNDQVEGVKKEFIFNVVHMLKIAKTKKIKVYMTFFDAHSYNPIRYKSRDLKLYKSIMTKRGSFNFLEKVISPLFKVIADNGVADQIGKIDLVNEGDTLVKRFVFNKRWKGVSNFICNWKAYINSLEGFENTPVSFSLRLHPLIHLPRNILRDSGALKCADFIDLHSYSNKGRVHRCKWIKKYAEKSKKRFVLGEFGQGFFKSSYDDELQNKITENYIKNASYCGFAEALAWRLSDIRPGFNKEARYSFEAYGLERKAFKTIQKHNHYDN